MTIECKVHQSEPELILYININGSLDNNQLNNIYNFILVYLNDTVPFKMFVDMRNLGNTSINILPKLLEIMNTLEQKSVDKIVATSILVGNIYIEKIIKMLFNIRAPLTPTKVVANVSDACDFLNETKN